MRATKPIGSQKLEPLSMVGCCFIVWGDKTWNNQGIIRGEPIPGKYLCQFFECLLGQPSTLTIMPIEKFDERPYREKGSAILFEDADHMRFWIDHVEGPRAKFYKTEDQPETA